MEKKETIIPYDPRPLERWQKIIEAERLTPEQRTAKKELDDALLKREIELGLVESKPVTSNDSAIHSSDFRSVVWYGTEYAFTRNQAACVKVLWEAWEANTPELDGITVVTQADVAQTRLIDVFRSKGMMHRAWGTMIIQGVSKGGYRLSKEATITQSKPGRKQSRKTTRKTHR